MTMAGVAWVAHFGNWLGSQRGSRSQCERLLLAWALGSLLFGCVPSREAMTAGEVGCRPSELSVHDEEYSSGWGQSADTWIAECRGRRFICTEVVTSSVDFGWLFSDSVDSRDSDVSCHEELSTRGDQAAQAEQAARAAAAAMAPPPPSEPPSGGAGFELGSARSEVRQRCEASGHGFRDEGAQTFCSGAAAPLGFAASTRLTFCGDALCGITIEHVPEAAWAEAFHDLDARLTEKYGPATVRQVRVPSVCRTPAHFDRCALDGALDFEVRWQWPRGERLRLLLDKPVAPGVAALRLMYVKPRGARTGVDSSAL
jgi:hypothetical protein